MEDKNNCFRIIVFAKQLLFIMFFLGLSVQPFSMWWGDNLSVNFKLKAQPQVDLISDRRRCGISMKIKYG